MACIPDKIGSDLNIKLFYDNINGRYAYDSPTMYVFPICHFRAISRKLYNGVKDIIPNKRLFDIYSRYDYNLD